MIINFSCITDTIKILLHRENPDLLNNLDLNNDEIFLEPLIFAYFNTKDKLFLTSKYLEQIMQGYFKTSTPIKLDNCNREINYLPKLGYYTKSGIKIQDCFIIKNTNIELIYKSFELLEKIFEQASSNNTAKEIIMDSSLFNKFITNIEEAFKLIKENSPQHFKLIEMCCKRIILFKTNPNVTNSFATINAHGMAFINAYQKDYNAIFFIDDIAHQTGHIILTSYFFKKDKIFKISPNIKIGEILGNDDYRDFYTLIHALYTYYTTFTCLNDCLKNNVFVGKDKTEAIARIGFYLNKCTYDLYFFDSFISKFGNIDNALHNEGVLIINRVKQTYIGIKKEWMELISHFNYDNQPYNFTAKIFFETNKFIQ